MTNHYGTRKSAHSDQISTNRSRTADIGGNAFIGAVDSGADITLTSQDISARNQPNSIIGGTLVAIAAALWALDGVLRRSLYSMPALLVVFFEHFLGSIFLAIMLTWKKQWGVLASSPRRAWMLSAVVGLLSGLIGTYLFTTALQAVNYIPFSVVLLLQKLQPIFAGATAIIFLKEKATKQYFLWVAAALVSAFFVTFPNGAINLDVGTATLAAAIMALGAAMAWGSSTTISKMLLNTTTVLTATSLRFFWTTLFSAIVVFLVANFGSIELVAPTQTQWLFLATITISTGMVALYIYYQGLKRTSVLISTIAELVFPALAVFIDFVLYKNTLNPSQYLAAICLVVCISLVVKSENANPTKTIIS